MKSTTYKLLTTLPASKTTKSTNTGSKIRVKTEDTPKTGSKGLIGQIGMKLATLIVKYRL
jgi:hypothetical protein